MSHGATRLSEATTIAAFVSTISTVQRGFTFNMDNAKGIGSEPGRLAMVTRRRSNVPFEDARFEFFLLLYPFLMEFAIDDGSMCWVEVDRSYYELLAKVLF